MNVEGFRRYLEATGTCEGAVERSLAVAVRFEEFCSSVAGSCAREATIQLATAFSSVLATESPHLDEDLRALACYAEFLGSRAACVVFQGALDGQRAFGGVRRKAEAELGQCECGELLAGIADPPLGAGALERAHAMHLMVDRLELVLGCERAAELIA